MIELRRAIFAMLLAVVYITAGLFSSLSVLLCDGHHHHHAIELCSHDEHCACSDPAFSQDCDCHSHLTLEESQSYYATDMQRSNDSRYVVLQLLNLCAVVPALADGAIADCFVASLPRSGYEAVPLQTAFISSRALRAPPVLA